MKILQIRFKNINNLKGEHPPLSFDDEPLKSAGIFAITGPTGSGKSTLLDVITLSLFNRVPRYKSKITKKEINDLGSIMTHHTKDAYAAIDFEIKGNKYTSEWRVSKNRNGKLNDYEMFIYDGSGKPLDLKKKDVPAYNEELIGLKYDQFVKSIILSQGQFSKFLKADENERGQLLENLTGTEIYRKIGKKIYEKNKEIKAKVELEKKVLDNLVSLSENEVKEISSELDSVTKQATLLAKKIKETSEASQIKKDLMLTKAHLLSSEKEAEQLKLKVSEFSDKANKLALHNKLNPIKEDIVLYKDAKSNSQLTAKNLSEYREQYEKSQLLFSKAIEEMAVLTKQEVTKENFLVAMRDFENEINSLDKDIANSKDKGQEIRARINKIKEGYSKSVSEKPSEALSSLQIHLQSFKEIIKLSNLKPDSKVTDSKAKLKVYKKDYEDLLMIKHEYDHLAEAQKNIDQTTKKISTYSSTVNKITPGKKKIEELISSYKAQLELLEKRKEDAMRIATLETHRQSLEKGEPCPLCGSKEHPFSSHLPPSEEKAIDQQISKTKENLKKQEDELNSTNESLTKANTSMKIATEELNKFKNQLSASKTSLAERQEARSNKKGLTADEVIQEIENLAVANKKLEDAILALEEMKVATQLQEGFEELNLAFENYSKLSAARKEKFEGASVLDITNKLQNDYQEHGTSLTRLQEAIAKETKDYERAEASVILHQNKLQPKLEILGFKTIEEMSMNFLEEKEEKEYITEHELLKKLKTEIETKIKSDKSKINSLTAKDLTPEVSFEDLELEQKEQEEVRNSLTESIGEKRNQLKADQEIKQNQKSKLEALERLNKELEKWSLLHRMIGDLNGNKFANFSQGLTLQNLLVYANKRLVNLTERYRLVKPKEGGTLQVMDLFQGNILRAVSTLSGGESFLISLALALSLSDMASRNVSLESLFIDEGFGTLDQETLDIAMNTLEKLQSESQKTVGVISHVEALKERINVQIKLEKNAQGYSTIKLSH